MISHGRIVHEGDLAELAAMGRRYRLVPTELERGVGAIRRHVELEDVRVVDGAVSVRIDDDVDLVLLTRALADAGVGVRALARETESLEQLFFELTEQPAEVPA
jgi:ABC-type uncharacterized transport system ATPase subunit